MALDPRTAYLYVNSSNEIALKIDSVLTTEHTVYLNMDGTLRGDTNPTIADDATHFRLYENGTLEMYRNLGDDGSEIELHFASTTPGYGTTYGDQGQYTAGRLLSSETLTHPTLGSPEFVHEVKHFDTSGNLSEYSLKYNTLEITGTLAAGVLPTTITLKNAANPDGITAMGVANSSAQGVIDRLVTLDVHHVVSTDGTSLVGTDGASLVGTDGASLIGTDGGSLSKASIASLIGQDGGSLIGTDGASLIGTDGASFAGRSAYSLLSTSSNSLLDNEGGALAINTLAMLRGYSAYNPSQNPFTTQYDDHGATAQSAGAIALDGLAFGTLEIAGDKDWYAVDLVAGKTYTFQLQGSAVGDGTLDDPYLRLLNASGAQVIFDDDSGLGNNAQFTFTATTSGKYFVEASAAGNNLVGSYRLVVNQEPSAAYVQSGSAVVNSLVGSVGSETSIVALEGGGYAVGFIARIDNQEVDNAYVQNYRQQIEIINSNLTVRDMDSRDGFTTLYLETQGYSDPNSTLGTGQLVANGSGYIGAFTDRYPSDPGPVIRATSFHGSTTQVERLVPLTDDYNDNDTSTNEDDRVAYISGAVDVALLSNGQAIYSFGHDGRDGLRDDPNKVVEVQVGAARTTVGFTGIEAQHQHTSISALGNRAVVVFNAAGADSEGPEESGIGVVGAIVNPNGSLVRNFHVNQSETYAQFIDSGQAVTQLKDGGFVVVWTSNNEKGAASSPDTDVYMRVFNADGSARSDELKLGDHPEGRESHAAVLATRDGGFAVTWQDDGIRMQVFTSQGAKVGAETFVGNGSGQSMTLAPDGRIAVAYVEGQGGSSVRMQLMETNSAPTAIALSHSALNENSPWHTAIGTLSATDANSTDKLTYELTTNPDDLFEVIEGNKLVWRGNPSDGDYETQSSYTIAVKVTDSASTSYTKTFTIHLNDVNEEVTGLKDTYASVIENTALNTTIGTLKGTDEDINETFTYSLVDGSGNALPSGSVPFKIVGDKLQVAGAINYEQQTYYSFYVRVSDGQFHKDVYYSVGVEDVDDAAPNGLSLYNTHVDEDAAIGTDIGQLQPTDPDTYDSAAFTYSIVNSDGTFKLIKDDYGYTHLVTNKALNYEAHASHSVKVRVADPSGGHYDKTFTIDVDDVNEAPTISGGGSKSITVNDGAPASTVIYHIDATDPDGDELEYGVTGPDGYFNFRVDENGDVRFYNSPDYDNPADMGGNNVYDFQVYASDGENDTYQDLHVTVKKAGNHAPEFAEFNTGTRTVSEHYDSLYVSASDQDSDNLTFSLLNSADKDKFTLTSAGGTARLQFKTAADIENPGDANHDGIYNLKLKVSDGTTSTTADINVKLEDWNEFKPVIKSNGSAASATLSVNENTQSVIKLVATDADKTAVLKWSLLSSDDKADFKIDSKTGQLSFAANPDYEKPADANKDNKYVVKVQVSDGAYTDTQALTIKLTNDDSKAITGGSKSETLNGTSHEELISGKDGNDTVKAGLGGDTINGGTGADDLYGGADNASDVFVFIKGDAGITASKADQIFDFKPGVDLIDLRGIDADPASGHQKLRFVTKFDSDHSKIDGQYRIIDEDPSKATSNYRIEIDTNGDKTPDMLIQVMNTAPITSADFLL